MSPEVMVSQLIEIGKTFCLAPVLLLCVYNIMQQKDRVTEKIKRKVKYGCDKGKDCLDKC